MVIEFTVVESKVCYSHSYAFDESDGSSEFFVGKFFFLVVFFDQEWKIFVSFIGIELFNFLNRFKCSDFFF